MDILKNRMCRLPRLHFQSGQSAHFYALPGFPGKLQYELLCINAIIALEKIPATKGKIRHFMLKKLFFIPCAD
jgi:hypothetical protein